jgi:hypothetical protein
MNFLVVALIANGGRMNKSENWSNLMPNITVAICAFDLVVGDMILMHELRGVFGAQYFRFIMALDTFSLWDMAVSLHDIVMTLLTDDLSCNILPMIETPTFDLNVPFGLNMTRGTTAYGT